MYAPCSLQAVHETSLDPGDVPQDWLVVETFDRGNMNDRINLEAFVEMLTNKFGEQCFDIIVLNRRRTPSESGLRTWYTYDQTLVLDPRSEAPGIAEEWIVSIEQTGFVPNEACPDTKRSRIAEYWEFMDAQERVNMLRLDNLCLTHVLDLDPPKESILRIIFENLEEFEADDEGY